MNRLPRAKVLPLISLVLASMSVLLCCGVVPTPGHAAETSAKANQSYTARGLVRKITDDRTKAVIRHEAIAGYMPAMTMEFNVRDTNELAGIRVGDTLKFRLTATEAPHWIDEIQRQVGGTTEAAAGKPSKAKPAGGRVAELKPGDALPDYELLSENGKRVRFSDFRGKVVAFTFIFTRCPLPDFCPRMGGNFAAAREKLLANPNAPTNWQFLSISFDPAVDKPAVLAGYADFYRKGNADRWLFAAAPMATLNELGPRIDLIVIREAGGSISHNLRTVVLGPDGRIRKQLDGNTWTPDDLAKAMIEAAKGTP